MKIGLAVLVALAILTIVEYFIATEMDNTFIPLTAIALVKAGAIVWYFMHIKRVVSSEGEH